MKLLDQIRAYFDYRSQIEALDSMWRGRCEAAERLGPENARIKSENERLKADLKKAEDAVNQMQLNVFIQPRMVDDINAKIADLNATIRSIADAEKIIQAAEVMSRHHVLPRQF